MLDATKVVYPVHAQHIFQSDSHDCRILTDTKEGVAISFLRDAMLGGQSATSTRVTLTCKHSGTVHGILVWWKLDLWDGITYSLGPGDEPFQDHWQPCVHPVSPSRPVQAGDTVTVEVSHDESRIFVTICEGDGMEPYDAKRPCLSAHEHLRGDALISPERAMQLGDRERLSFYAQGITEALKIKGKDASLLDLSDFSLCACIAARTCRATHVMSLESSSGNVPMTSARMCQLGNELPLAEASFEILQCYPEQLTLELIGNRPVDVVVAEPYFAVLEGWYLKEAINYYCLIRALRQRGILAEDAISVPATCRIMACGVECQELRSAYRACGARDGTDQSICGFDHAVINQHGADFESHEMRLPLWQYEYDRITADVELGQLNFCRPDHDPIQTAISLPVTKSATLDAIVIWVEYFCGDHIHYSTSGISCRHLIHRLNHSRLVDVQSTVTMTTSLLDGSNADAFTVEVSDRCFEEKLR